MNGCRSAAVDGFRSLAERQGEEGVTAEADGGTADNNEEDDKTSRDHCRGFLRFDQVEPPVFVMPREAEDI